MRPIHSCSLRSVAALFAGSLALASGETQATTSQCFGTVSNGYIEGSVKLPESGPGFSAYSRLGALAGRTHVHSTVAEIVVAAYAALQTANPSMTFVYGETGWPSGGRFRPHRTHQNGLSVDFFVPVRDAAGKSVRLLSSVGNRFGYDIEFDSNGKYDEYTIDFPAISEHLYQLHIAAQARGVGIALVIFDPQYLSKLFASPRGAYLQRNLRFMKGKPWVRHDEHYHVDFAIPCSAKAA